MDKTPILESNFQEMFSLFDLFEYKNLQEDQLKKYLVKMHKSDLYYYQNASSKFFNLLSLTFGKVLGNTSMVENIPAIKERVFETRELCEILNVSKQTIVFWVKKGFHADKSHIKLICLKIYFIVLLSVF